MPGSRTLESSEIKDSIGQAKLDAFQNDPDFFRKPLSLLNREAASLQKQGKFVESIAAYAKLFKKVEARNITHAELYTCYSNRAAAYLKLQLCEKALEDCETARKLAEAALKVNKRSVPGYIKTYLRKGAALNGLKRHREAAQVLEEALTMDPFNPAIKQELDFAVQHTIRDLLQGIGLERRALPPAEPTERISNMAYSTPLHKIQTEDMLPSRLMTPFQAESDHHVKDTYNYVTIQTDTLMPSRHIRHLWDRVRCEPFQQAVALAVKKLLSEAKDVRMLHLGGGAGLLGMTALRAGAYHVTAVERWLYLSLACKETFVANKFDDASYTVIYKRPTDLVLLKDVRICCNLLVCEMFDEGLLTAGLIPSMKHAMHNLMADDAIVVPASATVYVQAIEARTAAVCGIDLSPANQYRWHPAYLAGVPLAEGMYVPLSQPVEVWSFDLVAPPEESDRKIVDLHFLQDGRWNAVAFWFTLKLIDGIEFSTGPEAVAAGLTSLGPAVQYLAGEIAVRDGEVIPLQATHNTVRMRFDLEEAEYLRLSKSDAAFPLQTFSCLSDPAKMQAYKEAIERAVQERVGAQQEVHVLDIGCGSGYLSCCAAGAGAETVVACDIHKPMCDLTRKVVAANEQSARVAVIQRDAGLLERGRDVRPLGVNMVVSDFFDGGFIGNNFLYLLDVCAKKVMQQDCVVIPQGATLYCMGLEVLTPSQGGFDFKPLDKYRWSKAHETCCLEDVPHKRLTHPARMFSFCFDSVSFRGARNTMLQLQPIEAGTMNAVCLWFDLHLDEHCTLTTAPAMVRLGGVLEDAQGQILKREGGELPPSRFMAEKARMEELDILCGFKDASPPEGGSQGAESHRDKSQNLNGCKMPSYGQALQFLDRSLDVSPGTAVTLLVKRDGNEMQFRLREGIGERVERAPWKIEWGGGASVENPHYQRTHYCELLVSDFLMRVKSGRFPSIEKDMRMVLSHCGSLLLDPAALCKVYHELVVLERLHTAPEFSPGVTVEAITRPPLRFA